MQIHLADVAMPAGSEVDFTHTPAVLALMKIRWRDEAVHSDSFWAGRGRRKGSSPGELRQATRNPTHAVALRQVAERVALRVWMKSGKIGGVRAREHRRVVADQGRAFIGIDFSAKPRTSRSASAAPSRRRGEKRTAPRSLANLGEDLSRGGRYVIVMVRVPKADGPLHGPALGSAPVNGRAYRTLRADPEGRRGRVRLLWLSPTGCRRRWSGWTLGLGSLAPGPSSTRWAEGVTPSRHDPSIVFISSIDLPSRPCQAWGLELLPSGGVAASPHCPAPNRSAQMTVSPSRDHLGANCCRRLGLAGRRLIV